LNSVTLNATRVDLPTSLQVAGKTERNDSDDAVRADNKAQENETLSAQQLSDLRRLQAIDKRVRAHEQAHVNAAAGLVRGGASFTTKQGVDGQQYAVAGEVSIDTSSIAGDPQATILKARQIQRAAQAPVDPSAQDRAVAASAYALEQRATIELRDLRLLEAQSSEASNQQSVDEQA